MMPLMLGALAACSDDSEVIISDSEVNETRTDNSSYTGISSYYWVSGEKQAITLTDSKSYILFLSSDQDIVVSKLKEIGVTITEDEVYKSGIYEKGMEGTNNQTKYFEECEWAGVNLTCEQVLKIPEIIYAAPYFLDRNGNAKFCITSFIYVLTNGEKESVEQVAKAYDAHYIGYKTGFGDYNVHYIACTKQSKDNALGIANALVENHIFAGAEPVIMGPSHGHGFATEGLTH